MTPHATTLMKPLMFKTVAVSRGIGQGVAYAVRTDPGFVATRCEITGTEIGTQLTKFEAPLEVQFRSQQKDVEERPGKNAAAFLDAAQGATAAKAVGIGLSTLYTKLRDHDRSGRRRAETA